MATVKQRKAAEAMVENGGIASDAMRKAGYSEAMARNPQKVTKTKGFQELCDELGLTNNFLVETLVSDIKELPPKDRLGQLTLGAKMKGVLTEKVENEHTGTLNVIYRPKKLPANFDELSG